jgi:hypothetical protein
MTPDNARILADFGLRASDQIGEGGESLVYALGTSHVLRLPKRHPFDPRSRRRLQAFLAGIHGRLPFETPLIEEIGPNEAYTIEPRVPGKPMAEFLRAANDDLRDHALRNYVAAIDAFRTIEFGELPYGHILAGHPVNAGDWRTFVRDSLSRFRTVNRVAIAGAVGDPYRLFDKAADMIDQLPQHPPKYLVHGDYFPGNVLLAPDLSIAGVIDFGPFTVAGDPVLDLAVSYLTLELIEECSADDARFVRDLVIERHGAAIAPALRFYRAYLAFSMADPANSEAPYPRLYSWAIAMLKLLAEDRLPA